MTEPREPEDGSRLVVPGFVRWPLFPFAGDLSVKAIPDRLPADLPRAGEGPDRPCPSCADSDEQYLWTDDRWRVRAAEPKAVPLVFLETRDHVDLDGLCDELAAGLGRMIVRLERAVRAVGDIGRVHAHRWGDGGSHFHMWFFGRPVGAVHLLGFGMPMWAEILPPMAPDEWASQMTTIAQALASGER
jgi:hypothetical protein